MPEFTKTKAAGVSAVPKYVWILLAMLTLFVYFFDLTIPFLGPDEARYAQVAREMYERGDWITPTLGGFNWFEKPSLLYWLQIASYKLFGVNEFAARFGPALFGLGTIASLWILGRCLATENTEKTEVADQPETVHLNSVPSVSSVVKSFANYLALVAASTLGILVFSRGASFDIIITFPITAALVSFYIWHSRNELGKSSPPAGGGVAAASADGVVGAFPRPHVSASLFFFYAFTGLAVLAKGLIGIVFPFAIVGFYYLLSRRMPSRAFLISLIWGTLLAAAIASIWYLPMYQRHGYEFINEFFIQHHFQRFTSNKYKHPQPFYFFFWVLPLMTLPWLPFFFAAIWKVIKKTFHRGDAETQSDNNPAPLLTKEGWLPFRQAGWFSTSPSKTAPSDAGDSNAPSPRPRVPASPFPLLLFSTAWLLVPLAFFSLSGSKLPGYILPAVPAAIILTAAFIFELVRKSTKWRNAVLTVSISTFAAIILLLIFAVPRFAESDSVKSLIQAANSQGFTENRVLMMHTISHNAEFYAAGRLLRDAEGKQKKLYAPAELVSEMQKLDLKAALVIVPVEYQTQLTASDLFRTRVIGDNSELAIAIVSIN